VEYPDAERTVVALAGATCDFPVGSTTAVIGRSGSGKSTLVTVLALLRRPTAGEVLFDGRPTSTLSESGRARTRRRIGMVFQSYQIDERRTVRSNATFALPWNPGTPRRRARQQAADLLGMLGIGDLAHRRSSTLSGGQRQRLAIARAMCFQPELLIADEPTGNLDEETAEHVAADLFAVARQTRTTLVVVTHDEAVAALADRRVVMHGGQLDLDIGSDPS
jgi:ABC-type lipoprotein export system ATPase subunit